MFKEYRELDSKIMKILIPAILENALLMLAGMILTGYIGRLEVTEISSYGIGNRIFNIYFAIFKGFAIGALVVIARYYGSGKIDKCAGLYKQACLMFIPLSLLVALVFISFPKLFLGLMTSDSELLNIGASFVRAQLFCYPLVALIHLNSSAFQSTGDTKTPLYIAIIGNVMNVIFGYILIFGLGSFKGFGLLGAAYARTIGYVVMAVYGLYLLFGNNGLYEDYLHEKLVLDKDEMVLLIRTGVPAAIENSAWHFATVYVTRAILGYGQNYYAAYQIGLDAEGFCDMMSTGFMTAAMTLSAHAIGAKDKKCYQDCYRRLNLFVLIVSAITMAFLAFFSEGVYRTMTNKEELIAIGITYLMAMIWSQYPQHKQKITLGYIRSSGHNNVSLAISMIGIWVFRVGSIFLVSQVFKLSIYWIWWCFNLDQWARCLLASAYMKFTGLMDRAITD